MFSYLCPAISISTLSPASQCRVSSLDLQYGPAEIILGLHTWPPGRNYFPIEILLTGTECQVFQTSLRRSSLYYCHIRQQEILELFVFGNNSNPGQWGHPGDQIWNPGCSQSNTPVLRWFYFVFMRKANNRCEKSPTIRRLSVQDS